MCRHWTERSRCHMVSFRRGLYPWLVLCHALTSPAPQKQGSSACQRPCLLNSITSSPAVSWRAIVPQSNPAGISPPAPAASGSSQALLMSPRQRSILSVHLVAMLMPGRPCRGDGFATDPAFLKGNPTSSSAHPFFEAILDKPYLAQIVLAPHLYCPAVRIQSMCCAACYIGSVTKLQQK